jgi:hypothetical protein
MPYHGYDRGNAVIYVAKTRPRGEKSRKTAIYGPVWKASRKDTSRPNGGGFGPGRPPQHSYIGGSRPTRSQHVTVQYPLRQVGGLAPNEHPTHAGRDGWPNKRMPVAQRVVPGHDEPRQQRLGQREARDPNRRPWIARILCFSE